MTETITLNQVGIIESPYKTRKECPKWGGEENKQGIIKIDPKYKDCLLKIEETKYIQVITWFHMANREQQQCHPRGIPTNPLTGVFATRSPDRPNPLALSLVKIIKVDGCDIYVEGLDVIDGTPVIDIKPYMKSNDLPKPDEIKA